MAARPRPRSFWQRLSAEADRVGAVAPVARRHGVDVRTLTWWRWRLKHEAGVEDDVTSANPAFLPVVVAGQAGVAAEIAGDVEIVVGPVVIRAGRNVEYISTLVAALRSRC